MKLLSEQQKNELTEEKDKASKTIEANSELLKTEGENIHSLEEKIKILEKDLEDFSNSILEKRKSCFEAKKQSQTLINRIAEIERIEAEDKREASIRELIAGQPDFYASLEKRINEAAEEIDDEFASFVGTVEGGKAVQAIRIKIEARDFSDLAADLRGVKSTYEKLMRRICEKKIDGIRLTMEEASEPRDYLHRIVRAPQLITFWQR